MQQTNVMVNKLIQDFLEVDNINKLIIKKQITLEDGIPILSDLTQDVIDDITILDTATSEKLGEKIKQLNIANNTRKDEIKNHSRKPEDSIDERNLKIKLLKEDHLKYRRMITILQEIIYRKGWFE